jgi:hypothetical protein
MITAKQQATLLRDSRIDDVEDEALDEGRFFVHLKQGWDWRQDPHQVTVSKSFGTYAEVRAALRQVKAVAA